VAVGRDVLLGVLLAAAAAPPQAAPTWTQQTSGVTSRLRGVSAASTTVVWASGANGTVLRTDDGGRTWKTLTVPHSETLDFRDIDAVSERTAYVLSIGPGDASRIYKTTDAGATWTLQFRNQDPKAFFDAMAFRDARRGFAFSDSVDGAFVILRTADGGVTWTRIPAASLPPALPGEGAYAASGSNVAVNGDSVWIGTTASRVLRSRDGGRSWTVSGTPLPTGPSAGIFSVAFCDGSHGVVVGGDYKLESQAIDNAAMTLDGGDTWTVINALTGFRSAVACVPPGRTFVAVGPSGADVSVDNGRTWTAVTGPGFHAVSFAMRSSTGWAVGEKGSIARLSRPVAR
jgi:photosystem II stability/assembly factor-like uncharacterized protein